MLRFQWPLLLNCLFRIAHCSALPAIIPALSARGEPRNQQDQTGHNFGHQEIKRPLEIYATRGRQIPKQKSGEFVSLISNHEVDEAECEDGNFFVSKTTTSITSRNLDAQDAKSSKKSRRKNRRKNKDKKRRKNRKNSEKKRRKENRRNKLTETDDTNAPESLSPIKEEADQENSSSETEVTTNPTQTPNTATTKSPKRSRKRNGKRIAYRRINGRKKRRRFPKEMTMEVDCDQRPALTSCQPYCYNPKKRECRNAIVNASDPRMTFGYAGKELNRIWGDVAVECGLVVCRPKAKKPRSG